VKYAAVSENEKSRSGHDGILLPDDGRFAETGRGRLKIVYKKDRLRKYRLKKNTPRSLDFAA